MTDSPFLKFFEQKCMQAVEDMALLFRQMNVFAKRQAGARRYMARYRRIGQHAK